MWLYRNGYYSVNYKYFDNSTAKGEFMMWKQAECQSFNEVHKCVHHVLIVIRCDN